MAIFEYKHPLISHKLSILRNVETDTKLFRESLNEIASLMVYEATKDLKLKNVTVTTPIQETTTQVLDEPVTIVPILRAGLGMVDALLAHIPNAKVGHLGVYRNEETFEPVYYYAKMPSNVVESKVLIVDPMLATGGSIIYTIDYLKSIGVKNISVLSIIAAPEGILAIKDKHDDVDLYIASIDKGLNEHKYIYPGLGDAGDRIFGTK
ncbi:uracil phosphoribosyltransferase [Streptobacillus felis]|uniref:Uracil phosphoribosyltransferase n=1 Tax=Streptobacillus felis TaxID=1384509 RepID=A0A7Z0PEQ2_9FUSO|nr:uracil phosphoribosyltransferase [Streptobacillus felis]NYV27866.1 uracil phosphoribosyltransferase [Streptobacillus felis]